MVGMTPPATITGRSPLEQRRNEVADAVALHLVSGQVPVHPTTRWISTELGSWSRASSASISRFSALADLEPSCTMRASSAVAGSSPPGSASTAAAEGICVPMPSRLRLSVSASECSDDAARLP